MANPANDPDTVSPRMKLVIGMVVFIVFAAVGFGLHYLAVLDIPSLNESDKLLDVLAVVTTAVGAVLCLALLVQAFRIARAKSKAKKSGWSTR